MEIYNANANGKAYQYPFMSEGANWNFFITTPVKFECKIRQQGGKKNMTALMEYNLTEYTNFRELELQYAKVRDQNQELKAKIWAVQKMYEETCCATAREKGREGKSTRAIEHKYRVLEQEEAESHHQVRQIMASLAGIFHSATQEPTRTGHCLLDSLKALHEWVGELKGDHASSRANMQEMLGDLKQREKDWRKREDQFSEEIAQLQQDLAALEQMRVQMHNENNDLMAENDELQAQVRSYKAIVIEARSRTEANKEAELVSHGEESSGFGIDLLTFEKELLTRLFGLVTGSFHSHDIEVCLKKIYESYEEVAEAFREKLQIEYDLEDLESQYQKEKTTGPREVLVQLRGQINNFRKELQAHKELLYQRENALQERLKDLSGQTVHDNRLKTFTMDLQAKLRRQRVPSASTKKTEDIEYQQNLQPDEMMRQMIEKDRQNMENILKETRFHFQK